MDWEVLNSIPSQEEQLSEVNTTSLSVWENKNIQAEVRKELEKKWYNLSKMLGILIDVAENATKIPTTDYWPDYGKKLKAVELMMEASGYSKKKWWVDVKFSLSSLLYGKK
jgi:hypothetical protein